MQFKQALQKGFTLIEVMVALTVLALALAALIEASSLIGRNTAWINDKTFAHWVAMNKMAEYQLQPEWPSTGTNSGDATMGDREWEWDSTINKTEDSDLRRIDIRVRKPGDDKDSSLVLITGFIGKTAAVVNP